MYQHQLELPAAAHDDERRRLALALCARTMAGRLEPELAGGASARRATCACRILDARYEPDQGATVLYELDRRLVLGVLGMTDRLGPTLGGRAVEELGMRTYIFPDDPLLPGLRTALAPEAMRAALAAALPTFRVLRCRAELVRYRPMRRCTLRLDLWLRDAERRTVDRRIVYAKLYHDVAKAASAYEQLRLLCDSASLPPTDLAVPRPIAFLPELGAVVQDSVAGTSLTVLLQAGEAAGIERAASAVAALHEAGLATRPRREPKAALELIVGRAGNLPAVDRRIARALRETAGLLRRRLDAVTAPGIERSLTHGDCKPSQFLIDAAHVALLDFDQCGTADPASDVGAFVASLWQLEARSGLRGRRTLLARPLEERFLSEYCRRRGGDDAFLERVTWYQGWALLRKAYRAYQRSPRSPLPELLLAEARRSLREVRHGGRARTAALAR